MGRFSSRCHHPGFTVQLRSRSPSLYEIRCSMKLSIVATLYQSAPYIQEFYQRVSAIARQFAGDQYEIILVNDGSPDSSLELAVELTERDSHVMVVDLSRNFGHHKAMMTGLAYSKGAHVF